MSEPDTTTDEQPEPATDAPGVTAGESATRRLDPLSVAAVTVVCLAIALFATLVFVEVFGEDGDEGVDIDTVLENPVEEGGSGIEGGSFEVGGPAPDAELELLGGGSTRISDLGGTPAVINFWSSTCAPCLAEMPDLESVHQELGDEVAFLGIDVTDTVEAGEEMVEQTGVTYPNGRDPRGEVMGLFGGIALPRTVLLDADGVVVEVHNGEITASELTDSLDSNGLI